MVSEFSRSVAKLARELGIPGNLLTAGPVDSTGDDARDATGGTDDSQTRESAVAPGAGFFNTCGDVLREGVRMRYRAIQEHDRCDPFG